jgi:hypothetical protein
LRWGGDVTFSFHWLRFVLDLLVAHKLAAVRSRVLAQVILVIVLCAVPGGGGLNGCRASTNYDQIIHSEHRLDS